MSRARIRLVPPPVSPTPTRTEHGGCALENFDRSVYQSMRTVAGRAAPLPLTFNEAWAYAHKETTE